MQYLLLIYEGEKRLANLNKPDLQAELAEYKAFGKEFASSIQGGSALQQAAQPSSLEKHPTPAEAAQICLRSNISALSLAKIRF